MFDVRIRNWRMCLHADQSTRLPDTSDVSDLQFACQLLVASLCTCPSDVADGPRNWRRKSFKPRLATLSRGREAAPSTQAGGGEDSCLERKLLAGKPNQAKHEAQEARGTLSTKRTKQTEHKEHEALLFRVLLRCSSLCYVVLRPGWGSPK
jgi:hypothetical protein